jgi:hypothetical protein
MKGINSSRLSLAMSGTALFVALGGTALAVTQVGTSQIRNGAVTGAKIKNGAVSNKKLATGSVGNGKLGTGSVGTSKLATSAVTGSKLAPGAVGTTNLADGAVTSAKVLDGSLTASDVAANTFLPANGTAANSQQLGGLPASGFVHGSGKLLSNRIAVPVGSSAPLLELDFAFIEGVCRTGAVPVLRLVAELPLQNVIYTANGNAVATDVSTFNAVGAGAAAEATHTVTNPQSVTWQATYNQGTQHEATAWTTGQDSGGTCVFTGQGITTL